MSFTKKFYDKETCKQNIKETKQSSSYYLNAPSVNSENCYPYPVSVIPQKTGVSVFKDKLIVDISSELSGRNQTECEYQSKCNVDCDTGYPCGQGVIGSCSGMKSGQKAGDDELVHGKNCFIPAEETRTTNPSCNLRGTGWNRWEWVCHNPQKNIERSFPNNISNRIIVKDNHRPTLPNLIDVKAALPNSSDAGYGGYGYAEWN